MSLDFEYVQHMKRSFVYCKLCNQNFQYDQHMNKKNKSFLL